MCEREPASRSSPVRIDSVQTFVALIEDFPSLNDVKGTPQSQKISAGNYADKILTVLAHVRRLRSNETKWRFDSPNRRRFTNIFDAHTPCHAGL